MTITRSVYDGPITFNCDDCADVDETHSSDFSSALAKVKKHGWKVRRSPTANAWIHLCPPCAESRDSFARAAPDQPPAEDEF